MMQVLATPSSLNQVCKFGVVGVDVSVFSEGSGCLEGPWLKQLPVAVSSISELEEPLEILLIH